MNIEKLSQNPTLLQNHTSASAYLDDHLCRLAKKLVEQGLGYTEVFKAIDEIYPKLNWLNVGLFIYQYTEMLINDIEPLDR